MTDRKFEDKVYFLENLGCAHCAAKMEAAIIALPEVSLAQLTFATKTLKIRAQKGKDLLPKLQQLCQQVETGVVLKEKLATSAGQKKQQADLGGQAGKDLTEIILGALLFGVAQWFPFASSTYSTFCLIAAYIILGYSIILTAVKNIIKGNIFDENFLMTVATIGAFGIKAYEEAVGVMLFYRIGEFCEEKAVDKTRSQIMSAVDLRPEEVNLLSGTEVKSIPAEEALVGDILLVRAGDRIPLDAVVVEGESFLDTAPVTGEPVPVKKGCGDKVISGCINTSGMLKIRVEKILAESMVTKILDAVENAAANKPQIDRFITRFARVYTPAVVGIAILTAVVPSLVTGEWSKWTYAALTFLVISCPCALVLSVPLAFFSGIGAGSKLGVLFKGGVALEALRKVAVVVMDKTGTITKGNFLVQKISSVEGVSQQELLQLCAGIEQVSTHPIAKSIVEKAKSLQLNLQAAISFEELAGEGLVATTAQGKIYCGNAKLLKRFKIHFPETGTDQGNTEVLIARENIFLGRIFIGDTLKEDAVEAVCRLRQQGLTTALLTGDAEASALAVAKKVQIDEVRASLLPQDKLTELKRLRQNYGAVLFVGDGINDAPVLAGADVGAAMGSGADAAIEAADVVFLNSRMLAIPQAVELARQTNKIAWQNVYFAIVIKLLIMLLGLLGYASMWAAVFADTGVALLCVLNSVRILYKSF